MRRTKNGSTLKQFAYAKNLLGASETSKKAIALSVGYSPSVSDSVAVHIEQTEGFHNAMTKLASETGNFALQVYHALKSKDLSKESVPVLLNAITTMASAWEKFTPKSKEPDGGQNKLKAILLQNIHTQNVNNVDNPVHVVDKVDVNPFDE